MARRLHSAFVNPGVRLHIALRQAILFFFLLFLPLAFLSNLSLAEEAVSTKVTGISWPVLPGESVQRLAAQFFPNNNPMQQQFVTKTLELSREQHPTLTSAQVFKQAAVVTIPDLKTLSIELTSKQSDADVSVSNSTSLHLSYQLQYPAKGNIATKSAESLVPPAMQAEYERLLKRDSDLKQASQSQDEHIASLEKTLEQVKPKIEAILAEDEAEAATEPIATSPDDSPVIVDKPLPKASLLQQLTPFTNLLLAAGGLLVLLVLAWYSRRRREQKLASLTGLNTFMYDTLKLPEIADDNFVSEKAEVVDISAQQDEVASGIQTDTSMSAVSAVEAIVEANDQAPVKPESSSQQAQEDEAESVISSASILMGAGQTKQAQVLLEAYLQAHPQQSVYPWLYLLDIHRSLNQKTEYQRLLSRLHDNFNVMLPPWDDKPVEFEVPESLEQFPHIMKKLQRIWGKNETASFLKALLLDRREGERVGFSLQVLQEIAMLQKVVEIRDEFLAG